MIFKLIKGLVERVAQETDIPKEMIASKKLIHEVLSYYWKNNGVNATKPVLLTGWRDDIVGAKVTQLLTNN